MAGALVVTAADRRAGVTEYLFDWLSDASGNVGAIPASVKAGTVVGLKTVPDGGGTAPTDLYDLVLNDANGVDLLAGLGANLSGTVGVRAVPFQSTSGRVYFEGGELTLVVSNAGNAKGGLLYLWVRDGAP